MPSKLLLSSRHKHTIIFRRCKRPSVLHDGNLLPIRQYWKSRMRAWNLFKCGLVVFVHRLREGLLLSLDAWSSDNPGVTKDSMPNRSHVLSDIHESTWSLSTRLISRSTWTISLLAMSSNKILSIVWHDCWTCMPRHNEVSRKLRSADLVLRRRILW